jgi:hypothetical protein
MIFLVNNRMRRVMDKAPGAAQAAAGRGSPQRAGGKRPDEHSECVWARG